MKPNIKQLFIILLLPFIFSCTGTFQRIMPERATSLKSAPTLDQWIDNELVPYLIEHLTRHPRFMGQPFLIVSLKGDDVQADIDDLTDQIREKVMDALLTEPGIHLAWRPSVKSFQHHRRLADVACMDDKRIRYYIGIDSNLTKVDRNLSVKVRALNIDEGTWVSGFGLSYRTEPSVKQVVAIKHKRKDEFLRGLRPLPFTSNQPDLLASYLAYNLSCLFRQQHMDDIVVFVDPTLKETNAFFNTAVDLVGAYLSRFREVSVTDDPDGANVIINTNIHPINNGLYQIWVTAKNKKQGEYLPGTETETYVLFDNIEKMELHKAHNTHGTWYSGDVKLFLISQDNKGHLTRLFPTNCLSYMNDPDGVASADEYHSFSHAKENHHPQILDHPFDAKRVYAVSVTDPNLATWFENKTRKLQGICHKGDTHIKTISHSSITDFQKYLSFLTKKSNGKLMFRMNTLGEDS